jgi:hypothetical protein
LFYHHPAGFSIAGGALWASLVFCLAFAFYIATSGLVNLQ